MAHSYSNPCHFKKHKNPALLTLVNPGRGKSKAKRAAKKGTARDKGPWHRERLDNIEKSMRELREYRRALPKSQRATVSSDLRTLSRVKRKVSRMGRMPAGAPGFPLKRPEKGSYIKGPGVRGVKHRGEPGWHVVPGYEAKGGRAVPTSWQYWRNPMARKTKRARRRNAGRVFRTPPRSKRTGRFLSTGRTNNPRRRRRSSLLRTLNPKRRSKRTRRSNPRRAVRRTRRYNPRRTVRRTRRRSNPRRYARRTRRYNPRRGRRLIRRRNPIGVFVSIGAGIGGFLLGRVLGNLLGRNAIPGLPANIATPIQQNAPMIGTGLAAVGAYFLTPKVKFLAPYRDHLTIGAGIAFVEAVLARVAGSLPAGVSQYIAAPAPTASPAVAGYSVYEQALRGMGEYVPERLGEYVPEQLRDIEMLDGAQGAAEELGDTAIFGPGGDSGEVYEALAGGSFRGVRAAPMQGAPMEVIPIGMSPEVEPAGNVGGIFRGHVFARG